MRGIVEDNLVADIIAILPLATKRRDLIFVKKWLRYPSMSFCCLYLMNSFSLYYNKGSLMKFIIKKPLIIYLQKSFTLQILSRCSYVAMDHTVLDTCLSNMVELNCPLT